MPDEFIVTGDFELRTSTDARPRGKMQLGLRAGTLNKSREKHNNIKKDTQENNTEVIKQEINTESKK